MRFDGKQRRHDTNRNVRARGAKLFGEVRELPILFEINQDEFDEWIGLSKNRSQRSFHFFLVAAQQHQNRNDAVSARCATRDKTVAAGKSKPGFKENQQRGERGEPANEEEDELKEGAHTSLLNYL